MAQCLCGKVIIEIKKVNNHYICRCNKCKITSGSNSIKWICIENKDFQINNKKHYKIYKSSKYGRRGFCSNCGSNLTMKYTNYPKFIWVTNMSIENKN